MVFRCQFGGPAVIGHSCIHLACFAALFGKFYLLCGQSEKNLSLTVDFGLQTLYAALEVCNIA